jgi:iron/zinc/copper transport system substrate-binding protein/iron/zinc/copper transport system permease protein
MDWLKDPFATHLCRALVTSVLIAIACGVLGVYVVQQPMVLVRDAMAHTTPSGLAIAHLWG